jgi:putative Holliday junction resolvase
MNESSSVLGLDIGTVRVGVAIAIWPDGIPAPLTTLANDPKLSDGLKDIIETENVKFIVAGRPRSLNGNSTKQTLFTSQSVKDLENKLGIKIYLQDEAATSLKAKAELEAKKKMFTKKDVDALSAVYILEDFLTERKNGGMIE